MKRNCLSVLFFMLVLPALTGQTPHQITVFTQPQGYLPLGSSADSFTFGAGAEVSAAFIPGNLKLFGLKGGLSYLSLPLNSPSEDHGVWTLAAFAGPFVRVPFGDRLSVFAEGRGGYYLWDAAGWDAGDAAGGSLQFGGGAGALYRLNGPFTLGAGVSYGYYSQLHNGMAVTLALSLDFPGLEKETGTLDLRQIQTLPLFPVLYSYYAGNTVGSVLVTNTGAKPAREITVQFYVDRYMDNPMTVGETFNLAPGEEKTVDLYALFNENLMEITEGTKTSARVTVTYPGKKDVYTASATGILEFYNRNAMMWDDDRKVASFMTAKDPEIMNFAKNVVTWMQEVENPALDGNLQRAMALFEAVKAYGIRYQIDPATPFSEFSADDHAVDYLQFPRQTLQYTNGDCDDLTTLYAALLEAVGIESAFITVPGHIYAAFALKTPGDEVRRVFSNPAELIFIEGKAWLPVEITLFQDSFEKAWATGAKQWREHDSAGQAVLYPVREAWKSYQAVGFREGGTGITLPDRTRVTGAIRTSLNRHVEREIFPQVESLQKKLRANPGDIRSKNQLALVHARYGLYDQALEGFLDILKRQEYPAALTNAANVYYLKGDLSRALDFYNRALTQNGSNKSALIGSARCHYDLENYGLVKQTYAKIQEIDPDLAGRYAYLALQGDEAARASAAAELSKTVVWEDVE